MTKNKAGMAKGTTEMAKNKAGMTKNQSRDDPKQGRINARSTSVA
jgi:hypothetical protein